MAKEKARLLELRRKIKSGKPGFVRHTSNQKLSLGQKWRKPRGIQSKMRLNRKGHGKKVSPGFGSPAEVKGLSREGLMAVMVSDPAVVGRIDPSSYCIIISSAVGLRKRLLILREAAGRKIKVMNFKDPQAYLMKAEESMKAKKEEKTKKTEEKKKKKEELKKKAEEKEKEKKLEEELTDEEKKEKGKKEMDKVLTKKT